MLNLYCTRYNAEAVLLYRLQLSAKRAETYRLTSLSLTSHICPTRTHAYTHLHMHMHMHRLFLVLEYLNLKRSRTPFRRAPELRPSQGSSCAVTREAAREAGAAQEAQLAPTAQPQPPSAQA